MAATDNSSSNITFCGIRASCAGGDGRHRAVTNRRNSFAALMTLIAAFAAIPLLGLVSLALTLPPDFWRVNAGTQNIDRSV
jgi:hypothetical protein